MLCSFSSGRKRTLSCCTVGEVKMAREASSMTLPEELVEKIVAMMPFPTLFKARCLSKSWLTRFEPISSQKDATTFQKQVAEWSNRWDTFCHLYFDKEKLIGFNQTFENRVTLPSLSFLPGNLFRASSHMVGDLFSWSWDMYRLHIEGAFLYWTSRLKSYSDISMRRTSTEELYVANILTRQYKQLPPRPKPGLNIVQYRKLMSDLAGETYKMIVFCIDITEEEEGYCAQIYDSKLETWSSVEFAFCIKRVTSVYLDGVLYMLSADNVQNLLAFNLEQRTLTRLPLSFNDVVQFNHIKLVVCNSILVVIGKASDVVRVLKIDLESLRLWQVALFRPGEFKLIKHPVSEVSDTNQLKLQEGDLSKSTDIPPDLDFDSYCENHEFDVGMLKCKFFEIGTLDGRMLAYNQHSDEWRIFCFPKGVRPLGSICFQPGLNPFMPV